jgi:hypothetical protein
VAEGLRIGPPRDVTVPVRLGWLPTGLRITEVTVRPAGVDTFVTLRRDDVEVRLSAGSNRLAPSGGSGGPETTRLTVAGRPAVYRDDAKTSRLVI